jgi:hypothetical protein
VTSDQSSSSGQTHQQEDPGRERDAAPDTRQDLSGGQRDAGGCSSSSQHVQHAVGMYNAGAGVEMTGSNRPAKRGFRKTVGSRLG